MLNQNFQKLARSEDQKIDYPDFQVSVQCDDSVYGQSIMLGNDNYICHAYHPINEMTGELMPWAIVYTEIDEELTIYLIFRGNQTLQDAIIDVSCIPIAFPIRDVPQLMLHSGIVAAVTFEYDAIKQSLQNLMSSRERTIKFYCTGHSLGRGVCSNVWLAVVERCLMGHEDSPTPRNDLEFKAHCDYRLSYV